MSEQYYVQKMEILTFCLSDHAHVAIKFFEATLSNDTCYDYQRIVSQGSSYHLLELISKFCNILVFLSPNVCTEVLNVGIFQFNIKTILYLNIF